MEQTVLLAIPCRSRCLAPALWHTGSLEGVGDAEELRAARAEYSLQSSSHEAHP